MNVLLNLATEVEKRDLSLSELAREAGLSRSTVCSIAAGAPGRPSSRRKLRAALEAFPLLDIIPQTPANAPVMPSPDLDAIPPGRDPKVLLAQLQARKATWQ